MVIFQDKSIPWMNVVTDIKAHMCLSGSVTKQSFRNSMNDFRIIKIFYVSVQYPRPSSIKEVSWIPPLVNWVKGNIDGATTTITSACGGLFRSSSGDFLGGFSEHLGPHNVFFVEMVRALRSIETTQSKH